MLRYVKVANADQLDGRVPLAPLLDKSSLWSFEPKKGKKGQVNSLEL
jgi:hypothetical protein